MIDLVLKGAREQIVRLALDPFSFDILSANLYFRRARDLLADVGKTEAAFFFVLLAFAKDDFRIDEYDLLLGVLFEAQVDYRDAFRYADLRRRKTYPVRIVHRLEHILDERL